MPRTVKHSFAFPVKVLKTLDLLFLLDIISIFTYVLQTGEIATMKKKKQMSLIRILVLRFTIFVACWQCYCEQEITLKCCAKQHATKLLARKLSLLQFSWFVAFFPFGPTHTTTKKPRAKNHATKVESNNLCWERKQYEFEQYDREKRRKMKYNKRKKFAIEV